MKESPLKFCLSGSMSAQLGQMKRNFLNFTSAISQLELNVPLMDTSVLRRTKTLANRKNFNIGPISIYPILTCSLIQQVTSITLYLLL